MSKKVKLNKTEIVTEDGGTMYHLDNTLLKIKPFKGDTPYSDSITIIQVMEGDKARMITLRGDHIDTFADLLNAAITKLK